MHFHDALVLKAYNIRKLESLNSYLASAAGSLGPQNRLSQLCLRICFLAQLRIAFDAFTEIVSLLLSFEKIAIFVCLG